MNSVIILSAGSLLMLASVACAAPYVVQINLAQEKVDMNASLTIMANEVLNNSEEKYIILGSTGYFNGFNDGMTTAIVDTSGFTLTGNEALDVSDLGTELLLLQNAAVALGTDYGTGEATAYRYAIVVINTPFDRSSGNPGAARNVLNIPETATPAAPKPNVAATATQAHVIQLPHQGAYIP